jgi:hypothetical protein
MILQLRRASQAVRWRRTPFITYSRCPVPPPIAGELLQLASRDRAGMITSGVRRTLSVPRPGDEAGHLTRIGPATYYSANLYKSEEDSRLQTSIKKHIETIKHSGERDTMKMMKMWNVQPALVCVALPSNC